MRRVDIIMHAGNSHLPVANNYNLDNGRVIIIIITV